MDSPSRLTLPQIAWFVAFTVCYQWSGIDGTLVGPRMTTLITQELHRSDAELAGFWRTLSMLGAFSLVYGFLRDRWPWGDRRLLLILFPICIILPCFLLMGELTYGRLLGSRVVAVLSTGMMGASLNGMLSTMGRRLGATGRLAGFYNASIALIAAIGLEIGGFLGTRSFSFTLGLVALLAALLFTLVLLPAKGVFPPPTRDDGGQNVLAPSITPWQALGSLLRCRPFLVAVLYNLVWNSGPAYGTPLTVRLRDALGFKTPEFGHYGAISNIVGVVGSLAFVALAVRLSPRAIMTWGPLVYLPMVFLLFGMRTVTDAYVMIGVTCLFSSVLNAATFALLLRTVPAGLEGTGLALSATLGAILIGQVDVWATAFSARNGFFATVWVTIALVLSLPLIGRLVPAFAPEAKPA